LEKKRGVQSIDTGKKLTCYKSLLRETVSNKRKTAKDDTFPVDKVGPVVKRGSSGVKPPISSPSELGVSLGSEGENGWTGEWGRK
jgi:hypothetical protein